MSRNKNFGTGREHKVRDWLLERDYWVCRATGSLGDADLVALKAGDRRLVEVKGSKYGPYHDFPPAERAELSFAARLADCTAWLAWWPPRGELRWFPESEWPARKPDRVIQFPTPLTEAEAREVKAAWNRRQEAVN